MKSLIFILTSLFCSNLLGQNLLRNGSLEAYPRIGDHHFFRMNHWQDVSDLRETPPDIHSGHTSFWEVAQKPTHGETYVGLVTRPNGTTETIMQKLKSPLEPGHTYTLEMAASRAEKYQSFTQGSTVTEAGYTGTTRIQILGGKHRNRDRAILATSEPIRNKRWDQVRLEFIAPTEVSFLYVKVIPATENPIPGHVLIDNLNLLSIESQHLAINN